MENLKHISLSEGVEFSEDYRNLVSPADTNSVIITTEWSKDGDRFKKFSLYDNNYSPVIISSSTQLISEF